MASDAKTPTSAAEVPHPSHAKGIKIFTYPKIIFIYPTMIAALICALGMRLIGDETHDPTYKPTSANAQASASASASASAANAKPGASATTPPGAARIRRFSSTQNILAVIFLWIFAFNMIVMSIDFPRFTIFAGLLAAVAIVFCLLWLNSKFDIVPPIVNMLEGIYAAANAQFYFLFATIILVTFGLIYISRFLDFWEILPNEILHNHGPFSDLERYPTTNLKFDKEIPDILEYMMLGSGRLVLHVAVERKAIVLDNVLFIESKERELKRLMGRLEVRVTTDQEMGAP